MKLHVNLRGIMNLLEILWYLNGRPKEERSKFYTEYSIPRTVTKRIEECFGQNNELQDSDGQPWFA